MCDGQEHAVDSEKCGFKSKPPSYTQRPWASYFLSLKPPFLIWKLGRISPHVGRICKIRGVKVGKSLAHGRSKQSTNPLQCRLGANQGSTLTSHVILIIALITWHPSFLTCEGSCTLWIPASASQVKVTAIVGVKSTPSQSPLIYHLLHIGHGLEVITEILKPSDRSEKRELSD